MARKPKIIKAKDATSYVAQTHGDDRGGAALKAGDAYAKAKRKSAPAASTPSTSSAPKAKARSTPAGRMRRPEKDDVVNSQTKKPDAFSTGPSTRGGKRKAKPMSTGPSTRSGPRKSSVGTAGGGGASRDGKRPEQPGLIQKIRKSLGDGFSGGFMKKYRKK